MGKPLNEPLLRFADCDFLVHERIEAQALATPKAIALEFQSTRLTYQDLDSKSNQIAHYLQQSGIQSRALIGVALPRSPLLFVTLISTLR